MSVETFKVGGIELSLNYIPFLAWRWKQVGDLASIVNQTFGEQKPRRQLPVMSGRPHSDGERLAIHANLKRLLDD